jgi:hypothetical protein
LTGQQLHAERPDIGVLTGDLAQGLFRMYPAVLRIAPCCVWSIVSVESEGASAAIMALTKPKSTSIPPSGVTLMVAGFQSRQHLRLAPETRQTLRMGGKLLRQNLERHVAIQFGIAGDRPRPSCPPRWGEDFVGAYDRR